MKTTPPVTMRLDPLQIDASICRQLPPRTVDDVINRLRVDASTRRRAATICTAAADLLAAIRHDHGQ